MAFRGDDDQLRKILVRALHVARDLGHPRVGSEHLLLALSIDGGVASEVLRERGASAETLRVAVQAAAPLGAGAAADRELLRGLGVDGDHFLSLFDVASIDRTVGRQPLLPLGAGRSRRRCARLEPPLGLDAQAAYTAGLRLAVARREQSCRPEHLGQVLTSLDPGVAWTLAYVGVDRRSLFDAFALAFPGASARRTTKAARRCTGDLARRYKALVGRDVIDESAIMSLIGG